MYAWIWRMLPGSTPVRAATAVALAIAVVALLWFAVFPWAAAHLPIDGSAITG